MKNLFRLKTVPWMAGIIALTAVIVLGITACSSGGGGGGGNPTPTPTAGKLTITNFSGKLTNGKYVLAMEAPMSGNSNLIVCFASTEGDLAQVSGDTITLNVYKEDNSGNPVPFTGNITFDAEDFGIFELSTPTFDPNSFNDEMAMLLFLFSNTLYTNTSAVTFTNGSATINFNSQMEIEDFGGIGK